MAEIYMRVKHIKAAKSFSDAKNCPLANAAKEILGDNFDRVLGTNALHTKQGILYVIPSYGIMEYNQDRANINNMGDDEVIVRTFTI